MKKSLILAAIATVFTSHLASAQVVVPVGMRPAGYCAIQARLTINSGALGIALSQGQGFGRIVCDYRDRTQEIMPILIETSAIGVGVQLPEIMTGQLFAPGFGVTDVGAVGLLGTYGVIRATAGVGYANGEIGLGLTINETGFSIPAILQLDAGFHFLTATLNLGEMTIRFDPRNLQARYVHQLPVQHPRRPPHVHGGAAVAQKPPHHHHHQQADGLVTPVPPHRPKDLGAKTAPLPPKRPADLGGQGSSAAVPGASTVPSAKPAPGAAPAVTTAPQAPSKPAPPAPAPAAASPASAEADAEPVSRDL